MGFVTASGKEEKSFELNFNNNNKSSRKNLLINFKKRFTSQVFRFKEKIEEIPAFILDIKQNKFYISNLCFSEQSSSSSYQNFATTRKQTVSTI